jgi:hypothetical protein
MTKCASAVFIVATLVISFPCFSQGNTAIPFLMISPYTEANGMGEASVAVATDDPLAVMTNPAQLGVQSRFQFFSAGTNYSSWLPQFHRSDLWLRTYAVSAGINLKKLNENALPLSFGIGHSRVYLNLGEFIQTSENGPDVVGSVHAYESSDQFSAGMNLDYWIRLSGGVTYKHIRSHLSTFEAGIVEGGADLFDYGFLLDVPMADIVAKMTHTSFNFMQNVSPFFDLSIGISKSNLGQESITYPGMLQGDPLPRYARAGIGLEVGAVVANGDLRWKPCSFKWTTESDDGLVGMNRQYQSGLGDIHFFDEVILGNTNRLTTKAKGWEVNLLEIVAIRGGRFEEDPMNGNRRLNTAGWGIQSAGLVKLLRVLDAPIGTDGIAWFLLNHVNVRYNACDWTPDDPTSPLAGTNFNSVNFSICN